MSMEIWAEIVLQAGLFKEDHTDLDLYALAGLVMRDSVVDELRRTTQTPQQLAFSETSVADAIRLMSEQQTKELRQRVLSRVPVHQGTKA